MRSLRRIGNEKGWFEMVWKLWSKVASELLLIGVAVKYFVASNLIINLKHKMLCLIIP
jgi:hypothetical protein